MGYQENEVKKNILIAASEAGVTLFNCPTGTAYVGQISNKDARFLILQFWRVITFGLVEGGSDLIGWKPVVITQDMVGKTIAQFAAVETKFGKKGPTKEQKNFIERVRASGGIAGVARTEQEGKEVLGI